ncbi:MAG: IPT/TIG domain-containing protein, partial [Candidatus Eremiobacterota bacterium]
MKKQVIIGISGLILICLFIVMSGCGGGSSTINPVIIPTSNPTSIPTSQIPTATPWPVGTLTIHTNMAGKWAVMQAFFQNSKSASLDIIGSDYNPNQEKIIDESGNVIFNNVPLNSNIIIQVYNDSSKNTLLASTNKTFTGSEIVNLNQNEISPTPTGVIPIPTATNTPAPGSTNTPLPTQTPGGPTATNTPPAGATNTPTPAATNTATATPTATTAPSGNPSITSVTNNGTACTGNVARDNDSLTVAGTNFGSSQGRITINGVNATINSWSPTSITCTVASGTFQNNGP